MRTEEGTPLLKKIGRWFRSDGQEEKIEERMEDEIIHMVSEGQEQGAIDDQEAEMISNIMEFDDKVASEVMTHRKNIQAFEVNTPLRDAAIAMANERFSRYPIYEEEMDNIVGILHIKDVLKFLLACPDGRDIRQVMRKPYFVPETQNISRLFREMKNKSQHMAIIIDEYGQTAGVVSMEDILEEIVGNILDEYDVDEHFIQEIGDHTYLMRGLTELSDVEDVLDIRFKDDFDTLNGFLISKLEHIPSIHEKPSIHYQGYCFEIVGMADNIIDMVRVSKSESF
ncbi:MAG: HlyC/CorC family transporter [Lachnospiraceae bacterium]|nr:HlyC/CorC family transporter [Lachnospiraceae bacterium]